MKNLKIILITLIAVFAVSYSAAASDFSWTRDFNLQAQADPSGFKARIATRFNLGEKALNQLQQFRIDHYNATYLDQSFIAYRDQQDRYLPLQTSHIVNSIKEGVATLTQSPHY